MEYLTWMSPDGLIVLMGKPFQIKHFIFLYSFECEYHFSNIYLLLGLVGSLFHSLFLSLRKKKKKKNKERNFFFFFGAVLTKEKQYLQNSLPQFIFPVYKWLTSHMSKAWEIWGGTNWLAFSYHVIWSDSLCLRKGYLSQWKSRFLLLMLFLSRIPISYLFSYPYLSSKQSSLS